MRKVSATAAAVVFTALLCPGGAAWAQRSRGPAGHGAHEGRGAEGDREDPGEAIRKFEKMSPEEREKALRKLPADRQQKLRQQLQRYDELPQERKEQLQRFWKLPPEQQARVRDSVQAFNQAAPDRKQAMGRQLQQLEGMSEKERKAYFKSDQFKGEFSHDEQETLKAMTGIMPPE